MSQLLTDEKRPLRRTQQGDNLNVIARARTLTVLQKLGPARKRNTLHFLYESGLVGKQLVVSLADADLSGADLSGTNLSGANLSGAYLSGAYLGDTEGVTEKQLEQASLTKATMPNGQKYEERPQYKEDSAEDGESTGPPKCP